jgi:hypothetical protein
MEKQLNNKIDALRSILKEVNQKREQLKTQLHMYETYFNNTLSKTFKPKENKSVSSAVGVSQQVGPFVYKFSELEKNGVISSSTLSSPVKKLVKIQFSSNQPGIFVVVDACGWCWRRTELSRIALSTSKSRLVVLSNQALQLCIAITRSWAYCSQCDLTTRVSN